MSPQCQGISEGKREYVIRAGLSIYNTPAYTDIQLDSFAQRGEEKREAKGAREKNRLQMDGDVTAINSVEDSIKKGKHDK